MVGSEVTIELGTGRAESGKQIEQAMARKLKVFQTSLGFYDLAIAAPSMKAALEAWGADSNLFHQGMAKESDDPDVIAAAMSKPRIILRRPVGSDGPFRETADLPTDLTGGLKHRPRKAGGKPEKQSAPKAGDQADRKAIAAFEKQERRREAERRRMEAAAEKERERRQRMIDKAQAALERAEREHEERAASIEAERDALEKRSQAEDARWEKEREKLENVLRRVRGEG
jgi:colicin import membrane protein